jgi:mannosyltransferase
VAQPLAGPDIHRNNMPRATTKSSQPPSSSQRQSLLVPAILVLGFGLRVWGLSGQTLSMDEIAEVQNAAHGLKEIARTADGFPPLYNLLLHGWLALFRCDLAARWLSVLLGVLSIYFGWLLGRRIGGDAVGLWTALILAVSPLHIWYSQEARAYALLLLLATIALWALLRALESDSLWDWTLYTITAAAGMYVHYYFYAVVLVGVILVLHQHRGLYQLAKPIAAHSALAALCLPLLWLLPPDLTLQAGPAYATQKRFGIDALVYTYVSMVTGYTLGPSLRELHSMTIGEGFVGFLPWLALMALPLAALGYHGWRVLGKRAFERVLLLIATPVATVGIFGLLAGVGYNVRYVVWVAVPAAVLLAAGATRWRRWPVAAAVVVLLALFGIALANHRFSDRYRTEDMRALSAYLMSQREGEIPVFVLSGFMATPARYYLGQEWAIYAIQSSPRDSLRVSQSLQLIGSKTPAGKPYWLVYSRAFYGDPDGAVRNALEQRDDLRLVARFAGVVLYRGVRPEKVPQESTETTARPRRSAS